MLKIKDNVNLRELEKYGFAYDEYWYGEYDTTPDKAYSNSILDIIVERDGIKMRDFEIDEFASNLSYEELELLYDLIKADLVEKVENNEKIR